MDLQNKKNKRMPQFSNGLYDKSYAAYLMLHIISQIKKKTIFCGHLSHHNEYQLFYPKNEACTVHGLSQNLPKTEN